MDLEPIRVFSIDGPGQGSYFPWKLFFLFFSCNSFNFSTLEFTFANYGKLIDIGEGRTLQDDHDVNPPPSKWKAGVDVVYPNSPAERKLFKIPENIGGQNYIVTVYIGLYDPETNRRAQLNWPAGDQPLDRAYPVARFHVRRSREKYIYPEFDTTWNGPEPGSYNVRWSKRRSVATFLRYPKASFLYSIER